jgi:cobaltochelatase CobT
MGFRRELPEWYRPGSAPWFERGLGEKKIHPSALRHDRLTLVPPPPGDLNEYRALWGEVQREVGYLARRMVNLLREDSYLRYSGQYRSGNLHTAKLYKQRLGNYRLFERPSAGERSIAFQLLVDESASMKGQDKIRTATKTAVLLGETLQRMGVPLEIIGFTTADFEAKAAMTLGLRPAHAHRTTRCSPLEHRVYKRFDEPYLLVRRRLTGIEARHNNWDEEHLLFAHRRLQTRRERTKVMIVISDGQPNGDADFLIATLRDLESKGCRIIGVGIGADFVRQAYRRALVVHGFRQLAEELLALLAEELGRGRPVEGRPARLRTAA